ncbi:MAG TPA: NfeD family protein, partial [Gammaproteobacteria bacterium]|nr:NfeD family protein [Gammaproteobacteria bacterium]
GLIGGISAAASLIVIGTLWLAMRSHRNPVVSGAEEMLGSTGTVVADFAADGTGTVRVHSENWNAVSQVPLSAGTPIKVVARNGLKLTVEADSKET